MYLLTELSPSLFPSHVQIQEQGVSSEVKDDDGATPLHFAAGRGHAQSVRWLLANGCKINKDNLGGSPLHDAAEHGQVEVN